MHAIYRAIYLFAFFEFALFNLVQEVIRRQQSNFAKRAFSVVYAEIFKFFAAVPLTVFTHVYGYGIIPFAVKAICGHHARKHGHVVFAGLSAEKYEYVFHIFLLLYFLLLKIRSSRRVKRSGDDGNT